MKKILLTALIALFGLLFISCVTYTPNNYKRHYYHAPAKPKQAVPGKKHAGQINTPQAAPAPKQVSDKPGQSTPPKAGAAAKPLDDRPGQAATPKASASARPVNDRPAQGASPRAGAAPRPDDDLFNRVNASTGAPPRQSRSR